MGEDGEMAGRSAAGSSEPSAIPGSPDATPAPGRLRRAGPGCRRPIPSTAPADGVAVAERSIAHVQQQTGITLTRSGRVRLAEAVTGLVAHLLEWQADPDGGPPDPWTCVRRRWHRHESLRWWGDLPLTARRMLTGIEPHGCDSLIQLAWLGTPVPPALRRRWLAALLDLDPAADIEAAERLARRRASRRRSCS